MEEYVCLRLFFVPSFSFVLFFLLGDLEREWDTSFRDFLDFLCTCLEDFVGVLERSRRLDVLRFGDLDRDLECLRGFRRGERELERTFLIPSDLRSERDGLRFGDFDRDLPFLSLEEGDNRLRGERERDR